MDISARQSLISGKVFLKECFFLKKKLFHICWLCLKLITLKIKPDLPPWVSAGPLWGGRTYSGLNNYSLRIIFPKKARTLLQKCIV